jgi:phosphoglycolate phosphatase-like HAD superfamily hydrolase
MTNKPVLFIDDGGVLSDNARRAEQWPRLVGEFMSMRIGGDAAAWAASNRESHLTACAMAEHLTGDFATWQLAYARAWFSEMGASVGIDPASDDETLLALYQDAHRYITPRVDAAIPGAPDAVRALHAAGYTLHTASGETSTELHGYTTALGIRDCFVQLFGPDLVDTFKNRREYHQRVFEVAGVDPANAIVFDNDHGPLEWIASLGAKAVRIGNGGYPTLAAATSALLNGELE